MVLVSHNSGSTKEQKGGEEAHLSLKKPRHWDLELKDFERTRNSMKCPSRHELRWKEQHNLWKMPPDGQQTVTFLLDRPSITGESDQRT